MDNISDDIINKINDVYDMSMEEKLIRIGIPYEHHKYFSSHSANIIYDCLSEKLERHSDNSKLLSVINMVLKALKKEMITDLNKFLIERDELKKFDGIKFLDDNMDTLMSIGLTKNALGYRGRTQKKMYGIILLKGAVDFYGYNLQNKRILVDGKRKTFYCLERK